MTTATNGKITTSEGNRALLLLKTFVQGQDVRKSSKKLYMRTLKQFFVWLQESGRLERLDTLTKLDIISYKETLLKSGLSPLTVGSYLSSVKRFYEWTESERIYPNIAKGIKAPRRENAFKKQHLTAEEVSSLLEELQGSKRDFALVNLLVRTGLRTIEASRALIGDIRIVSGKRVLFVHGKGRDDKSDFVVLTDKAYQPIREYLTTRGKAPLGAPLFVSDSNNSKGAPLSTRTISGIVKTALKGIGIDSHEYTAHSLRHTTAVQILKAGGTLLDVQDVLRHKSPTTSQIYTASIKKEMRLKYSAEALLDNILN